VAGGAPGAEAGADGCHHGNKEPDWEAGAGAGAGAGAKRLRASKFSKWRSFGLGLGGLAELGFLVLFEIVHVAVSVGFEPVLMSFDGQRSDKTAAGA
jgi:hypothetical protein